MTIELPKFGSIKQCNACGGTIFKKTYIHKTDSVILNDDDTLSDMPEHISLRCIECGKTFPMQLFSPK